MCYFGDVTRSASRENESNEHKRMRARKEVDAQNTNAEMIARFDINPSLFRRTFLRAFSIGFHPPRPGRKPISVKVASGRQRRAREEQCNWGEKQV